jgi:hypothetical protein
MPRASATAAAAAALTVCAGAFASAAASVSVTTGEEVARTRIAASNTAAMHRVALPASAAVLKVSNLEGTLEILTKSGAPITSHLPGMDVTPCEQRDRALAFDCSTALFEASLITVKGVVYLDLRLLRGLPTADGPDGPPRLPFSPEETGLGGACPGTTPASRGECAYQSGDLDVAVAWLTMAANQPNFRRYATLRFGDISLRRGDADLAISYYRLVSSDGFWGRLASMRISELTGQGLRDERLDQYDSVGLPPSLHTEMTVRNMRALALLRRWSDVLPMIAPLATTTCAEMPDHFCHRLVLAALHRKDAPRELALEAYLSLPIRTRGPLASELALAAANAAGALGAPQFGATLLAATVREVEPADLERHLRLAFNLYLSASDPVRAQVIADYAIARLPKGSKAAQPSAWVVALPEPLPEQSALEPAPSQLALGLDPAQTVSAKALLAIANSTLFRARQVPVKGRK